MPKQTTFDYLRNRLLVKAGLPIWPATMEEVIARVHREAKDFFQLMRNRLYMGHFRYGPLNHPDKPSYNCIASIRKRLTEYERTGNTELLVDIANLALVEFVEGDHPSRNFTPADGGGCELD